MLTKKQKEVLDFLNSYSGSRGYAPSLDEIRIHFKLSSVSTAHYYVDKLSEEGYLKKISNQSRGIDLETNDFIRPVASKNTQAFSVPIMGAVNAGEANIFAEENIEGYLKIPNNSLSKKEGVFALRVEGDSMNKATIDKKNIEQGDFVLIDSQYRNPKNGDFVLSIIDGCANIKKFERNSKNGEIRLMSESTNLKHKPIYISSEDNFMINGKVMAIIKK